VSELSHAHGGHSHHHGHDPENQHHPANHSDHHEDHHEAHGSIFPMITGIGAALMLFGTGASVNGFPWGLGLSLIGLTITVVGTIGWWWELSEENKRDVETLVGTPENVRKGLKLGFGFFIGSEVMFFSAFFAYYFYSRFHMPAWPPAGYERLPLGPALINTALLVSSGAAYHFAEHNLLHHKSKATTVSLISVALLLGAIFLGVQANEWLTLMEEHFTITDGIFGTAFYLLTGFHGMHVIIGALFIAAVLGRVLNNHFTPKKHFAMTSAGWYWHFVDVVWIGLVLALYVF
jgi:cytochrome c oxidase subunit III